MRLAQAGTGLATLLAVGLLASCGGGGGGSNEAPPGSSVTTTHHDMTTQSATPSTQELAQTYLRIARPVNAEIDRFTTKVRGWNDQTTNAQAA
jgi:hypothetical protein